MVKKDNTWEYVFGKASSNREDKISTFKVISIPRYLKEGAQPDYGVNNIGINIDNVVLVQEGWYELSGNKLTELSNTFENGKSYVRKLAIITDYPHYFDTKENHLLEDKVNGESVKDYSNYTYNNNNTKADYVIEWALDKIYLYVYYPYVGCVEEKIIDRITIETATYPMIGEKLAFGYSILESGIVCTSKDVWSLSVNGRDFITLDHNMTNTFEEGEIYKLEFDIKVEKGYYLNDSVLAFINGNIADIETKDDIIHISYLYPKLVNTHTHSFTIQNPDKIYLAKEATCTSKALYFYSCSCKEHNDETFEYGETLAHTYSDKYISCLELGHRRICDICGSESEIIAHVPNIDKATIDNDKYCIYCLFVLEKKIEETSTETNVQTQETTSTEHISTECIHEKSDNYGFDSEGHYEICKKCLNKISEKEKHIFTNNKCIICGYEQQQTQTKISPFIWFIGGFVLIICAAVVVIIVRSKKK